MFAKVANFRVISAVAAGAAGAGAPSAAAGAGAPSAAAPAGAGGAGAPSAAAPAGAAGAVAPTSPEADATGNSATAGADSCTVTVAATTGVTGVPAFGTAR